MIMQAARARALHPRHRAGRRCSPCGEAVDKHIRTEALRCLLTQHPAVAWQAGALVDGANRRCTRGAGIACLNQNRQVARPV